MRAVVQRVKRASVTVDGEVVGSIGHGVVVFLGVGPSDSAEVAVHFADRIATLRIHADEQERMNRDLAAVGGAALVVSQFTLFGDTTHGHRPSFTGAGSPELGERLCEVFVDSLRARGIPVETGRFGAHMDVDVVNDGPVTLVVSARDPGWETSAG